MKKKIVWVVVSCLMVLALLAASCAKAAEKAPAPAAKEAAPVVKEAAPVVKEVAPAVKEAAPAEEKPRYGGELIRGRTGIVLGWDEAFCTMWMLSWTLGPTNEELLVGDWTRGPAGAGATGHNTRAWLSMKDVTGQLAESWELADPETIVLHIRKGVHYALDPNSAASRLMNGREFVADDAVFSIKRIMFDLKTSPPYGCAGVSRPTDVYATDKYTVVLKAPPGQTGATLEHVSEWMKMYPPEVVKKYGDMNDWKNVVGTGPFILTDYVPMSSVSWVRNPNYWGKNPIGPGKGDQLPYVDSMKTLIIPDMSTIMAAIRTGRIDFYEGAWEWTWAKQLLQSSPWLKQFEIGRAGFTAFSMRVDKPELPWYDLKVRRALLMAVDEQTILDTYYEGKGDLLTYKVWALPDTRDFYTPVEQLPPESRELFTTRTPDKSKQLLAEAGYPNGFKAEIILTAAYPAYLDLAQILKEYWSKIGVDLTLDVREQGVYDSIKNRRAHTQMLANGRGGVPFGFFCHRDNMYNSNFIKDPKIEKYYADVTAAFFDEPKRNAVMKEANLYIISQAWYWTPPSPRSFALWPPWVKNYNGEQSLGIYNYMMTQYLWLDQGLKKSMGY